jgi:acetyltransferase-like isoleucine patch superfamily enzyme
MTWLSKLLRRKKRKPQSLRERYAQYDIGRESYGDLNVRSWNEGASLQVGAFCSIAAGVKVFLGGEHRTDWVTTFPFPVLWPSQAGNIQGHPRTRGDVIIGNDVWIGTEAVIMSGVQIGDGAVIGARSVVTGNVPPYAIFAGNPARLIRFRFEPEQIERLLATKWWALPNEEIGPLLPHLLSNDIEAFLRILEK